jgi:Domain of unknown function (DUF222)/HNH endonuclease
VFVKSLDDLSDEIASLAAHLNAATARWLTLVAEFDERGGWGREGCKTCAHWVSWRCAVSPGVAREHVRVARRLRDLPAVAAAFARGELSYSKVRAITRVEEIDDEEELIALARNATAAQLDRVVRGYRSVLRVEADADRAYEERSLTWYWDDDGTVVLRGRLPAEQGALLVEALEAARDALGPPPRPTDVSAGTPSATPVSARNADALLALADASLDSDENASTADRYQVVVHIDAEALPAGTDAGGSSGRCELEVGVPLAHAAARRLSCDASLVAMVERNGQPLSIGRKTRTIPPALRRALRSRDGGCAFPGCTQTRHVDAHHIEHWSDGGRTDLVNLVQLCRHHHRLVHEGGYTVRHRGRRVAFWTPDGCPLPHAPRSPRGECDAVIAPGTTGRARVSAEALVVRDGERMRDLGLCVDALLRISPPRRE